MKLCAKCMHGCTQDAAHDPYGLLSGAMRSAAHAAGRALVLEALERTGWNLTHAAQELGVMATANLIRSLRKLAPEEYAAARRDGRIKVGGRRPRIARPRPAVRS